MGMVFVVGGCVGRCKDGVVLRKCGGFRGRFDDWLCDLKSWKDWRRKEEVEGVIEGLRMLLFFVVEKKVWRVWKVF